jgi:hypothetical protein
MTTKNLTLILRLLVSGAFLFSGISKLIAPGFFEITLIDQGIMDERNSAAYLARFIIGLELAIGLMFLQPYYLKKIITPSSIILVLVFTGHLLYLIAIGDTENCGCFGDLIDMSPTESVLKNVGLLGLLILLFFKLKPYPKRLVVPFSLLALSVIFVFLLSPIRKMEDSQFGKFTHFEGKGRTDLSAKDNLMAIFNTDCEHCQEAARELKVLGQEKEGIPELHALFFSEGTVSVDSFNTITGTQFPYQMIEVADFMDYIGNAPPRIYLLQDGRIKKFWDEDFSENLEKELNLK